jgi:hypothetical protein
MLGCGEQVRSLMRRNLIDEFVLLIHPLPRDPRRPAAASGPRRRSGAGVRGGNRKTGNARERDFLRRRSTS